MVWQAFCGRWLFGTARLAVDGSWAGSSRQAETVAGGRRRMTASRPGVPCSHYGPQFGAAAGQTERYESTDSGCAAVLHRLGTSHQRPTRVRVRRHGESRSRPAPRTPATASARIERLPALAAPFRQADSASEGDSRPLARCSCGLRPCSRGF